MVKKLNAAGGYDLQGSKMTGMATGTSSGDAATKGQMDTALSGYLALSAYAGAQTLTDATKSYFVGKSHTALILERNISDDVASTDADLFQAYFRPNNASGGVRYRTFRLNEWGAIRVEVPATHLSETPIKVKPGTARVISIGSSSDINDEQWYWDSDGEIQVGNVLADGDVTATGDVIAANLPPSIESGDTLPSAGGYAEGSIFFLVP